MLQIYLLLSPNLPTIISRFSHSLKFLVSVIFEMLTPLWQYLIYNQFLWKLPTSVDKQVTQKLPIILATLKKYPIWQSHFYKEYQWKLFLQKLLILDTTCKESVTCGTPICKNILHRNCLYLQFQWNEILWSCTDTKFQTNYSISGILCPNLIKEMIKYRHKIPDLL